MTQLPHLPQTPLRVPGPTPPRPPTGSRTPPHLLFSLALAPALLQHNLGDMSSLLRSLLLPSHSSRGYSRISSSASAPEAEAEGGRPEEEEELYRISSSPLDSKPLPPTPRSLSPLQLFLRIVLWLVAVVVFFGVGAGVFLALRALGRSEGADAGIWSVGMVR